MTKKNEERKDYLVRSSGSSSKTPSSQNPKKSDDIVLAKKLLWFHLDKDEWAKHEKIVNYETEQAKSDERRKFKGLVNEHIHFWEITLQGVLDNPNPMGYSVEDCELSIANFKKLKDRIKEGKG